MSYKGKKALVLTIGTGTRPEEIDSYISGILRTIKDKNPDIILFINSRETHEKTYPLVRERLDLEDKIVYELILKDENDISEIVEQMHQEISKKLIMKGVCFDDITIDITFGTKVMSAGLLVSAVMNNIKEVSYVSGKRKGGIVLPGTERVLTVELNYVFDVQKLMKSIEYFNTYQFKSAISLCEEVSFHLLREKKEFLLKLYRAYDLWDKFDFDGALSLLKEVSKSSDNLLRKCRIKSKIERSKEYLHKIKDCSMDSLNDEIISEVINNAVRRCEEGKYDDAMARLYRALEMIGQKRFKEVFGCTTDNVKEEKMPDEIRNKIKSKVRYDGKIKFGLFDTFDALYYKGDEVGKKFYTHFDVVHSEKDGITFKKILGIRNSSILAHGIVPVKEAGLDQAFKLVKDVFNIKEGVSFIKLDWKDILAL